MSVYSSGHTSNEDGTGQYGIARIGQKLLARGNGDNDEEWQEVCTEEDSWDIERHPVVDQVHERMIVRSSEREGSWDTVLPLFMKLAEEDSRVVQDEAMDKVLEKLKTVSVAGGRTSTGYSRRE